MKKLIEHEMKEQTMWTIMNTCCTICTPLMGEKVENMVFSDIDNKNENENEEKKIELNEEVFNL